MAKQAPKHVAFFQGDEFVRLFFVPLVQYAQDDDLSQLEQEQLRQEQAAIDFLCAKDLATLARIAERILNATVTATGEGKVRLIRDARSLHPGGGYHWQADEDCDRLAVFGTMITTLFAGFERTDIGARLRHLAEQAVKLPQPDAVAYKMLKRLKAEGKSNAQIEEEMGLTPSGLKTLITRWNNREKGTYRPYKKKRRPT